MQEIKTGKTIETILLRKETYRKLKWLQGFLDKGRYAVSENMIIYVIGASLVASDGDGLGRIDIPEELKEYCKKVKFFTIVKMTTNPYFALLDDILPSFKNIHWKKRASGRAESIKKLILDTKTTTEEKNRVISVNEKLLGKLSTMPTDENSYNTTGRLDIYIEDKKRGAVVVTKEALSIIMPMHHPTDFSIDSKAKFKLSEKGKELVESAGIEVKEEDGEEASDQNIQQEGS